MKDRDMSVKTLRKLAKFLGFQTSRYPSFSVLIPDANDPWYWTDREGFMAFLLSDTGFRMILEAFIRDDVQFSPYGRIDKENPVGIRLGYTSFKLSFAPTLPEAVLSAAIQYTEGL